MKIEFTTTPKFEDIDFLTQKINQETFEYGAAHPFAFLVKNNEEEIIAGCNGSIIFGAIYTDQLWVHPEHRKEGLGSQLMERVHGLGLANHCTMSTISTMTFQKARRFYEKLGYVVDFERKGYANKASLLFLKKKL